MGALQGTHKVHTSSFPFQVLYLSAVVSLQDIQGAVKEIGDLGNVDVVYAGFSPKKVSRGDLGRTS